MSAFLRPGRDAAPQRRKNRALERVTRKEQHGEKNLAAHDARGHGNEQNHHAKHGSDDPSDSFHNAVSLPRWDSGAA